MGIFRKYKEIILTAVLVLGPLFILIGVFFLANASSGESEKNNIESEESEIVINPFENIIIEAESAYVKNIHTGEVLFSKKENLSLPLASLTKIMTALAAYEILEQTGTVQIDRKNLERGGGYSFLENERFRLKDLIDFTLVGSSNDGASALAFSAGSILKKKAPENISNEDLFILHMNKIAERVGMDQTRFRSETGLDIENKYATASGSAKDISRLFEYVLKNNPEILTATVKPRVTIHSIGGFEHTAENTNEITNSLPNILGSKTGFTDTAGGNLSVIIDPGLNTPVVITVLGSSKEGRFYDVGNLANATLEYLGQQDK